MEKKHITRAWRLTVLAVFVGSLPLIAGDAITPQEVTEFRARHEAEWKSRMTPGSRLFYRESEWPDVLARVRALEGPCKKWRELSFATAAKIIEQPLPVYRPPEAFVGSDTSPAVSREELWQRPVGNTIVFLAFMARLDDNPKYKTYLRDLVLAALGFDTWGHKEWQDNDLAAASIVRGVAIAWDWHRDIFDAAQQAFIRETMARRVPVLLAALHGKLFWGKEYRANHNHICTSALGLAGLAFLEEIPEAGDWLAAALLDYERIAQHMNADGSSEEGLGYWSYGMNYILQFIEGTRNVTGSASLYNAPFLRNAANYRLACSTPGFEGVLMWGDATGKDFYGPQQILYRLASQYRDESAQFLADRLPFVPRGSEPPGKNSNDVLAFTLLWYDPTVGVRNPEQLDFHIADWGVITSRSGWGNGDYLFSIKAGLNNRHHSHLDAGALAFNFGGTWLLTTPGYGEHGQEGFWDREGKRWTFFSNASEAHSTLLLNGKNQRSNADAGGVVSRMVSGPRTMYAEVDLTRAYEGVKSVTRRILHRRGEYILVMDDIDSREPAQAEWLAQVPPRAILQDDAIVVTSNSAASLRIQLLGDPPLFVERQPLSPHFNIAPNRLKTLAAKSGGATFSALLRPFFPGEPHDPWTTSLEESDGKQTVRIDGENWKDVIEVVLNPGQTANLGDSEVHGTGNALAVRKSGETFASLVISGAFQLDCPAFSFQSEKAVNVSVEWCPDGSYAIDLDGCLEGEIHPKEGFNLQTKTGERIPEDKGSPLAGGSYFIRSSNQPTP